MPFLTEIEPPRGVATEMLPGIRRLVADNPGVMTYHGTNTYLIGGADGLTVLDPGPDDAKHVEDIVTAAAGVPVARIVLTHTHIDHFGATAALKARTGAPVYAYQISARGDFAPDVGLDDGDAVGGLRGVFTPGHAADHLCFEYQAAGRKILFSGDHVMSWSSSIVNPPEGDMQAYYRSLQLLLARDEELYLPAHGPLLPAPRQLVAELLAHRQRREAAILAQLKQQDWTVGSLAEALYAKADPRLKKAAQRNVLAHFLKLGAEGIVVEPEPPAALPPDVNFDAVMSRDALRRFALAPAA